MLHFQFAQVGVEHGFVIDSEERTRVGRKQPRAFLDMTQSLTDDECTVGGADSEKRDGEQTGGGNDSSSSSSGEGKSTNGSAENSDAGGDEE